MTSNTKSEAQGVVPSEYLADTDTALRTQLTSGVIGLTNGLTYNPNSSNRSPVAPNGLVFNTVGVSNGLSSRFNGITDFTAYNPYIHYYNTTKINIMPNLVLASARFEIYSRQYRG